MKAYFASIFFITGYILKEVRSSELPRYLQRVLHEERRSERWRKDGAPVSDKNSRRLYDPNRERNKNVKKTTNAPTKKTTNAPTKKTANMPSKKTKKSSEFCSGVDPISTDVIVIGAGYAGIRAAAVIMENAPELDVVLLESTNRIGGRAKSETMGGLSLELGPKWLYTSSSVNYVTTEMFLSYNLSYGLDNYTNIAAFGYHEDCSNDLDTRKLIEKKKSDAVQMQRILNYVSSNDSIDDENKKRMIQFLEGEIKRRLESDNCVEELSQADIKQYYDLWNNVITPCINSKVDMMWENDDYDFEDEVGVVQSYIDCGFDEHDPYESMVKWIYHEFNYGASGGSALNIDIPTAFTNSTQDYDTEDFFSTGGGVAKSLQNYASEKGVLPVFGHRVKRISYGIKDGNKRARVEAETDGENCAVYEAQRVISTVSAGIYNHEMIAFNPPLRYPEWKWNPMIMGQYLQVYFQFETKFWEEKVGQRNYIYTVSLDNYDGISLSWTNLDHDKMIPGSKTLMLTMVTEDFYSFFGTDFRDTQIPNSKLIELLDPLKKVFGDDVEDPVNILYNKFHADENTGFGAYSYWQTGYGPEDYFKFWGRYDFGDYLAHCQHNGCNGEPNDPDSEWVLYLSGASSCLDYWEEIFGAWYSGEMSAYLMLESLGIDLHDWRPDNICYSIDYL